MSNTRFFFFSFVVLSKYVRFPSLLVVEYILSDLSKIDVNINIVVVCTGLKL